MFARSELNSLRPRVLPSFSPLSIFSLSFSSLIFLPDFLSTFLLNYPLYLTILYLSLLSSIFNRISLFPLFPFTSILFFLSCLTLPYFLFYYLRVLLKIDKNIKFDFLFLNFLQNYYGLKISPLHYGVLNMIM